VERLSVSKFRPRHHQDLCGKEETSVSHRHSQLNWRVMARCLVDCPTRQKERKTHTEAEPIFVARVLRVDLNPVCPSWSCKDIRHLLAKRIFGGSTELSVFEARSAQTEIAMVSL